MKGEISFDLSGADDELIDLLFDLKNMTPEQRYEFDRQRAEWKDAGGRDE